MSDWADEKARELPQVKGTRWIRIAEVATALRQARADALEEAAEAVAFLRWLEVDPYDGRSLGAAVNAIRSLKDKQP